MRQIDRNMHTHERQHFQRISPFGITPVKKHIRLGHAGIMDHVINLSIPNFQKVQKKEWTEAVSYTHLTLPTKLSV